MKVKVKTVLEDIKGAALMGPDGKPLVIGEVLQAALLQDNEKGDVKDAVRRFNLARDIETNDEVELSAEDVVMLKKSLSNLYKPLVAGQVCLLLEGKKSGIGNQAKEEKGV